MATDQGIRQSQGVAVTNTLPLSWLGRADAPSGLPTWATIGKLSPNQTKCLVAEIGYDQSLWDYAKVGEDNQVGRYQFSAETLESYGILAPGSVTEYGNDAVNYLHCWTPSMMRSNVNSYLNYMYSSTSLQSFLINTIAQDHLAYKIISDLHIGLKKINAITPDDNAEVAAGMIYVAWNLGVGTGITNTDARGTGAYAWRYSGMGDGGEYYNVGRYAVSVLSR